MIWKISCTFAASYPENNLFTLMETNTYWRFGAVACEGHRFFLFIHLLHQIAYSIYCSQEESIQLKGNITWVGRLADCSQQTCRLEWADLLTRLSRAADTSHNFNEGIFLNQRSRILKPKKTSPWTREDISLNLRKYIIEPNKEHYTIHESLIW